jgi:parallel beta-helix repeat protein
MDGRDRRFDSPMPGACAAQAFMQIWPMAMVMALCLLLGSSGVVSAKRVRPTPCASTISSCGCTIQVGGLYTVTANLSASQGLTSRGACLDINDSNTTLDLKKFTVTGGGTGIGIHILAGAYSVTVVGSQCCATISGWNIGLQDDEDKADIAFIDVESSVTSGILLEGVINSQLWEVQSNGNGGAGVLIMGKPDNHIFHSSFAHNQYGVSLQGSSRNRIENSSADDNDDGIIVSASSRNNHIISCDASSNSGVGILVSSGSSKNVFGYNHAISNGNIDAEDDNSGCDSNIWFADNFDTVSQNCIQ